MAIYIDRAAVPDLDNISAEVFAYLIRTHKKELARLQMLNDYYLGRHKIFFNDQEDEKKVRIMTNYAKYVVDIGLGYFLGEPVKYNNDVSNEHKKRPLLNNGVEASIKNGSVQMYDWKDSKRANIDRLIEVYDNQTMSDIDAKIGKQIGIFGKTYELLYANSDDNPEPRSTVIDPRNCIMVRDNTVEHKKLFCITYEVQEDLSDNKYYAVTVYNDHMSKMYKSADLETFEFKEVQGSEEEHYFGEVPVVEYNNNDEKQGDFEQVISLIDGLNELMSDRVTDKKKFVKSLLAMYGVTLEDDNIKTLADEQFLDGIPVDARIEYVQKVFDESSLQILCNDIIREIHKITLTVDMTDENFAGNSSGQAMKLKLLTMNMLVKNKMRSMEKGLKKRLEMYNTWLNNKGEMQIVDKKDVDVIFTISMPINEQETVQMVKELQGIVDDKTLLSQLWFIKDVDEVLAAVKQQKQDAQKAYLDSFGIEKNGSQQINHGETEEDES